MFTARWAMIVYQVNESELSLENDNAIELNICRTQGMPNKLFQKPNFVVLYQSVKISRTDLIFLKIVAVLNHSVNISSQRTSSNYI